MGHLVPVTVPPFRSGGEFTLGAEDELLLTRADGTPNRVGADATIAKLRQRPALLCSVSPEEYADEIEFGTPICDDAATMADALAGARAALQEVRQGAMAVGVHPAAGLGDFQVSAGARYGAIGSQLAGFLRTPTAAFQVHVGMPDTAALVAACRGVRNRLARLRGLAAGSPFWHGRDSGLASARGVIHRSYPRTG